MNEERAGRKSVKGGEFLLVGYRRPIFLLRGRLETDKVMKEKEEPRSARNVYAVLGLNTLVMASKRYRGEGG